MMYNSNIILENTIIKLIRIFLFLLISLAVIYNSGYALITLEENIAIMLIVPATFATSCFLIFKVGFRGFSIDASLVVLFIMLSGLLLSLIYNSDFSVINSYLRFIFVISLGYTISQLVKFETFINIFTNIIKLVSLVSLIFYIGINFLNINLPLSTITNTNGVNYLNGYIYFIMEHVPERNTGIFWEPGIFSSFIIISLVLEISFKKKINKKNVLLFALTLLTTLSTAGYFLLALVAWLMLNRKYKQEFSIPINTFILILMVLIFVKAEEILKYLSGVFPYLLEKVVDSSNSVLTRVSGPKIDFDIFMNSPLFGVGFRGYQIDWANLSFQTGVSAQTSTLTYFIATLGILGFIYLSAWVIGILKISEINIISRVIILFIFVIILTKEPHQHNVAMYIFMFYFLNLGKKKFS